MKLSRHENLDDERLDCDECGEQTKKYYFELKPAHVDDVGEFVLCRKCYSALSKLVNAAKRELKARLKEAKAK